MRYAIIGEDLIVKEISDIFHGGLNEICVNGSVCDIGYYYNPATQVFSKKPYEDYDFYVENFKDTNCINNKLNLICGSITHGTPIIKNSICKMHNYKSISGQLLPDGTMVANGEYEKDFRNPLELVKDKFMLVKDNKVLHKFELPYLSTSHELIYGTNQPRYYSPYFDYATLDTNILFVGVKQKDYNYYGISIYDEVIVICDYNGNIIWEWNAIETVRPSMKEFEIAKEDNSNFKASIVSNGFDWFHINGACRLGKNKWFENGDKRFNPNNIMISARNQDCIYIIDYDSKDIVWTCSGHSFSIPFKRQHYAHLIPDGFEGAGNILLFSNGDKSTNFNSFVMEFNPITKDVVYYYDSDFNSIAMSNVQKLPNGDYLIGSSYDGKVIVVNKNHEVISKSKINTLFYRVNAYPEEWFKNAHFFDER